MRSAAILAVAILALAAGCTDPRAKLVGMWKLTTVERKKDAGFRDVAEAFAMGFVEGATLEFNKAGRFKLSYAFASTTGEYTIRGETIELKLANAKEPLRMKFGSKVNTLEIAREFESDPTMVFEKQ